MGVYSKSAALAKRFDSLYPRDLPARLAWWRTKLGIDGKRFLRMLGLDKNQATEKANEPLTAILRNPGWENNAWVVEGTLHRLLSLYGYDWKALAVRLHSAAVELRSQEASRITRKKGETKRLLLVPDTRGSETLLNQIANGGPEALLTIYAYFVKTDVRAASDST